MLKQGKRNKFNAHKIKSSFGTFDSRIEMNRYLYLQSLESKGDISELRKQVEYEIIPRQTYRKAIQLKTKVRYEERVLEQAAYYTADFVYKLRNGTEIVEDVKSKITRSEADYILRRKLMRLKGYTFHEVLRATDPIPDISTDTNVLLTDNGIFAEGN